jgi:histidinol dehydrogenase
MAKGTPRTPPSPTQRLAVSCSGDPGPIHALPTGGAGRSFAGLTVDQFQRRTSVVEYGAGALKKALPAVRKFAELEGLDAHGRSAEIRVKM